MKKIILFIMSLFVGSLYSSIGSSPKNYSLTAQEKKGLLCSLCRRILAQEDFFEGGDYSDRSSLLCRFCFKMLRGKKDGKPAGSAGLLMGTDSSSSDDSDEHDFNGALQRLSLSRARRRGRMIVLREARTGLERKDKHHFKKLVEKEVELARQHAWTYRVLDNKTIDVENGVKTIHCTSKIPLTSLLCKGSCAIFSSERGHRVHDFATDDTASFFPDQLDKLNAYVEALGQGTDFGAYVFPKSGVEEGKVGGGAASKKSLLISSQERELRRKKEEERREKLKVEKDSLEKTQRLCFSDADTSVFFTMENQKPQFYYAVAEDKKTLLVGNEDGYILQWPVEKTITGLLARGTEAVITTNAGGVDKQLWHDFARHNEDDTVVFQEHPITTLEAPLQPKSEFMKQGFLESAVRETTFDQMFHEMAIIPEGFMQTLHHPASLQEFIEHLKHLECREGRSLFQENHEYRCELDAKTGMVDVSIERGGKEEEEGFEVVVSNPKDRVWKRGAEVLVSDNGYLVLYNFKTEEVERFDTERVAPMEDIERALVGLKFNEIK